MRVERVVMKRGWPLNMAVLPLFFLSSWKCSSPSDHRYFVGQQGHASFSGWDCLFWDYTRYKENKKIHIWNYKPWGGSRKEWKGCGAPSTVISIVCTLYDSCSSSLYSRSFPASIAITSSSVPPWSPSSPLPLLRTRRCTSGSESRASSRRI